MLYKFREAQLIDLGLARSRRRPFHPRECQSVADCEGYRREISQELSQKVARIQDLALNDFQIRELNDEINRLVDHRRAWDARIVELGGVDHSRTGLSVLEREGKTIPGAGGYRYYGRARDLPGVRELLLETSAAEAAREAKELERANRWDLYRRVDADYYGYRDEDDGRLLKLEGKREVALGLAERSALADLEALPMDRPDIPTQSQVEQFLLQQKKKELVRKYLE